MLKNHVFGSLNLNNSEIFRLSFEDIFLGRLDTYTKKMNPPSAVLGGGCTVRSAGSEPITFNAMTQSKLKKNKNSLCHSGHLDKKIDVLNNIFRYLILPISMI